MLIFSVEDMQDLATRIAALLKPQDCLTLQGDLGAGKTTFVQALVRALSQGVVGVQSPTFNLLQTYDVTLSSGKPATIWHYDLYRIEEEEELEELGLGDALAQGITLIEWPEMVLDGLPRTTIRMVIDFGEGPTNRNISFYAEGETLARLKEASLC